MKTRFNRYDHERGLRALHTAQAKGLSVNAADSQTINFALCAFAANEPTNLTTRDKFEAALRCVENALNPA